MLRSDLCILGYLERLADALFGAESVHTVGVSHQQWTQRS